MVTASAISSVFGAFVNASVSHDVNVVVRFKLDTLHSRLDKCNNNVAMSASSP